MKRIRKPAAAAMVLAFMLAPGLLLAAGGHGARSTVQQRVNAMLRAYAANDPAAVLAMVDPHGFVMYGSDVAEVVRTPAELRQLMADDFKLWQTASFGTPSNVDIRVDGTTASAFFDVPFSAGGRPPVTVRFCTVWHQRAGKWLLVQSANAVPTVGSSAHALTTAAHPAKAG